MPAFASYADPRWLANSPPFISHDSPRKLKQAARLTVTKANLPRPPQPPSLVGGAPTPPPISHYHLGGSAPTAPPLYHLVDGKMPGRIRYRLQHLMLSPRASSFYQTVRQFHRAPAQSGKPGAGSLERQPSNFDPLALRRTVIARGMSYIIYDPPIPHSLTQGPNPLAQSSRSRRWLAPETNSMLKPQNKPPTSNASTPMDHQQCRQALTPLASPRAPRQYPRRPASATTAAIAPSLSTAQRASWERFGGSLKVSLQAAHMRTRLCGMLRQVNTSASLLSTSSLDLFSRSPLSPNRCHSF